MRERGHAEAKEKRGVAAEVGIEGDCDTAIEWKRKTKAATNWNDLHNGQERASKRSAANVAVAVADVAAAVVAAAVVGGMIIVIVAHHRAGEREQRRRRRQRQLHEWMNQPHDELTSNLRI